jgi:hypothetical protein
MPRAVYGIARSHADTARLIDAFRAAGFKTTDLSVLAPHSLGDEGLAIEKQTKALEGTATGASAGGVLGGVLGLLVGLGTLAIPGLGMFVAAGPLLSTLSGIGIGGSMGGLAGGLIGMGIPEYEAKAYEGQLEKGGILISVHCRDESEIDQARDIMKTAGAQDIAVSREAAA